MRSWQNCTPSVPPTAPSNAAWRLKAEGVPLPHSLWLVTTDESGVWTPNSVSKYLITLWVFLFPSSCNQSLVTSTPSISFMLSHSTVVWWWSSHSLASLWGNSFLRAILFPGVLLTSLLLSTLWSLVVLPFLLPGHSSFSWHSSSWFPRTLFSMAPSDLRFVYACYSLSSILGSAVAFCYGILSVCNILALANPPVSSTLFLSSSISTVLQ